MLDRAPAERIVGGMDALLEALPVEPGRVRARRLFRSADVTVLGVAMDGGAVMRGHKAAVPILIQVVTGSVVLGLPGRRMPLPAGAIAHVGAREVHAVEATARSRLLVILLGSPETVTTRAAA